MRNFDKNRAVLLLFMITSQMRGAQDTPIKITQKSRAIVPSIFTYSNGRRKIFRALPMAFDKYSSQYMGPFDREKIYANKGYKKISAKTGKEKNFFLIDVLEDCDDNTWMRDRKRLAILLVAGAHPNSGDPDWGYLLHKAVECGDYELVRFAIESGASLNLAESDTSKPISFAQTISMAKLLIDCGSDVETDFPSTNPVDQLLDGGSDWKFLNFYIKKGARLKRKFLSPKFSSSWIANPILWVQRLRVYFNLGVKDRDCHILKTLQFNQLAYQKSKVDQYILNVCIKALQNRNFDVNEYVNNIWRFQQKEFLLCKDLLTLNDAPKDELFGSIGLINWGDGKIERVNLFIPSKKTVGVLEQDHSESS